MTCLDCEQPVCPGCNASNWAEHITHPPEPTKEDILKAIVRQHQEKEVIYQQRLKAKDAEIAALEGEKLMLLKECNEVRAELYKPLRRLHGLFFPEVSNAANHLA